jgi:hypothetical protein
MAKEIKTIFLKETLNEIPVFYRYMTEFETAGLGELKLHARFSKCDNHFSSAYFNFIGHKPMSNIDIIPFLEEEL